AGEELSPDQERPLCGLRRDGPAAAPSRRIAGGDHLPHRLLPVIVPEVAGGDPVARGAADRLCRPGLRGARHGHGRDGGVLSGKIRDSSVNTTARPPLTPSLSPMGRGRPRVGSAEATPLRRGALPPLL